MKKSEIGLTSTLKNLSFMQEIFYKFYKKNCLQMPFVWLEFVWQIFILEMNGILYLESQVSGKELEFSPLLAMTIDFFQIKNTKSTMIGLNIVQWESWVIKYPICLESDTVFSTIAWWTVAITIKKLQKSQCTCVWFASENYSQTSTLIFLKGFIGCMTFFVSKKIKEFRRKLST